MPLTLTRFANTALAGAGHQSLVDSPVRVELALSPHSESPHSALLSGALQPEAPGRFGFDVSFDPPLTYPDPSSYARLWVNDHLLHPRNDTLIPRTAGAVAPAWIPLPPRPLDGATSRPIDFRGAPPLGNYTIRLEYVCVSKCDSRQLTLRWAAWSDAAGRSARASPPPFAFLPSDALLPEPPPAERARRALATRLQSGWGTFYNPSIVTWALLPEGFAVSVGLYRLSTRAYLDPSRLTIDPSRFGQYVVRAGLHSYDQSFSELSLAWRGDGGGLNVTIAATAERGSSALTLLATVSSAAGNAGGNASDFALVLLPAFRFGRAGAASVVDGVDGGAPALRGDAAGLRSVSLHLVGGNRVRLPADARLPAEHLGVSLAGGPVALSTDPAHTRAAVASRTASMRAREARALRRYGALAEQADALQTSLMWSVVYEPKEGLIAPVTRNWRFEGDYAPDGTTNYVLFCWDGSFASYMLSLSALDLALSNLAQVVKMRTSAGFVPSYSAGTHKTRDRSNPPVTARVLLEIVRRWGLRRVRWAVELLLDDLLVWNAWIYANRLESPANLPSWGSNPYPYADDGTGVSDRGCGGGCANLESGLDNGPLMDGLPFNVTGRWLQDEYDAGYTGLYLMDCAAQAALAEMVGRADAAAELRSRYAEINASMHEVLWDEPRGYFVNRRSARGEVVERMAPTNLYPMAAGASRAPPRPRRARTCTYLY